MNTADIVRLGAIAATAASLALTLTVGHATAGTPSIYQATTGEPNQKTPEISTEQLRHILADGSALVLDSRSQAEFDAGHIPGAHPLDGPASQRVALVERLVGGDKSKRLVLYCNGPYCGASKRAAAQLAGAGFTNVQRYQLGMPVWRALGGTTEIGLGTIVHNFKADRTVVYIDARSAADFAKGTLPGAHNMPIDSAEAILKKMAGGAVSNAPLPTDDFNRRVVLFGHDAAQARKLADVLSRKPWHNVSYFAGSFETLAAAVAKR
jgi:rhodanese-related sulfurtransferase